MIALTKLCTWLQSLGLGLFENVSFKSQKALYLVRDIELRIASVHILLFKKISYKAFKALTEIHSSERPKQKHAAFWHSQTLSFAEALSLGCTFEMIPLNGHLQLRSYFSLCTVVG